MEVKEIQLENYQVTRRRRAQPRVRFFEGLVTVRARQHFNGRAVLIERLVAQ